jgi:hypothetical protein
MKITSEQFDYLKQLQPIIHHTGKNAMKELKYSLMDTIERAFKGTVLKGSTRDALEEMCFLAKERGFVHTSPRYLNKKCGVGESTIYTKLKMLIQDGVLYKRNFSSKEHNGNGCGIYFFVDHPNFAQINSFLHLVEKADKKAENAEIPCESKEEETLNLPTISLPKLKIKDIDLQSTVPQSANPIIQYVPKEINTLYAGIFSFRLRNVWQKVTQAFKSIKQTLLDRMDLITIGTNVIKRLLQKWKEHQRDGRDMPVDQMCAFVYVSARESFYNTLAEIHMQDLPEIEEMRDLRLEHFEEAKREIPYLEDTFLKRCPYASPDIIKTSILGDIPKIFPLLLDYDIGELYRNYWLYSRLIVHPCN